MAKGHHKGSIGTSMQRHRIPRPPRPRTPAEFRMRFGKHGSLTLAEILKKKGGRDHLYWMATYYEDSKASRIIKAFLQENEIAPGGEPRAIP